MSRATTAEGEARTLTTGTPLAIAGALIVSAAMLGLAALVYLIPPTPRWHGPIYERGAALFSRFLFNSEFAPISQRWFISLFVGLVLVAWMGYALALFGLYRGGRRLGWILAIGALLATSVAVLFPASLTHDLFAYLGFGRIGAIYGLNSYQVPLTTLARQGDVAALHYPAPHPSIYGPLWTMIVTAVAWTFQRLPLVPQLIALKMVDAVALVGAALAARSFVAVRHRALADVAMAAVLLNPFLLLEGPANGHADLPMVALMLAGVALLERGSTADSLSPDALSSRFSAATLTRMGWLLIGLSVAVKFVSLAFVPMLMLAYCLAPGSKHRIRALAEALGFTLLPLVVTYAPFWTGFGTFGGIFGWATHRTVVREGLLGPALVVALYVAVLVWQSRSPAPRLAPAWSAWSLAAVLLAFPTQLPWYMGWPVGVALIQWRRKYVAITALCLAMAFRAMFYYIVQRAA